MALNVSKICFNCKPTNQQTKYLKQYLKEAKYKSTKSFAPLVRVYEVLREKGLLTGITGQETLELMQNRMEAIIVALEVFCFKQEQLSIEDFVSLITNMYNAADKLGISLDRFPAYITELKDRIDALRKEIDQIEAKKQDALRDHGMTLELLQEYNANKSFLLRIQNLKQQLVDAKRFFLQFTWKISVDELNNASIGLGLSPLHNFDGNPSLSGSDLKKWVMDVFYHPSKYVEVIRQTRDIYNSQYKSTTASTN